MKNIFNKDINYQIKSLIDIVNTNHVINEIFNKIQAFKIPEYYIGAGCIAQTVWNYLSELPLSNGINDIDIVYFDDKDISSESEAEITKMLKKEFADLNVDLDVNNQARVHLWYKEYFGYEIEPIISLEDAINRWPTTATSIGMRKEADNFRIYAPYGLNDLFGKIVRANKTQITKEIYEKKVKRWKPIWSDLTIIEWDK